MDEIRALFLHQSMLDCEEMFAQQVRREDSLSWDWLVITAANSAQAQAYRAQIDKRLREGQLPSQTRYAVISDPGGKRVGSGGATLNVLRKIAREEGGALPFEGKRILVLHSGGDSQRIAQYSACGKLFSRVPRLLPDGRPSTLFDEFCISLACVPARMQEGVLLMSGDVLLLFNALQIDLERTGAACLSIKAPVDIGTRHGVFLPGENGGISAFLHKQSARALKESGAVNAQGMVDIDTGAIWLDARRTQALYSLVGQDGDAFDAFVNEHVRLNLYGDFVYAMSAGATLESYLAEPAEHAASPALEACRRAVWNVLGDVSMALLRLAPGEFIHFGTTKEWRSLLLEGVGRFSFLGWQRSVMAVGSPDSCTAINAVIEPGAQIGEGVAIEDSRIGPNARIGRGSIVSGAALNDPLPEETVLHVLPIDDGQAYCARLYGVADNPKEARRFGKPLDEPLWTAPLHPVAPTMEAAVHAALHGEKTDRMLSLRDGFLLADVAQILSWQEALTDDVRARRVMEALGKNANIEDVLGLLSGGDAGERQILMLRRYAMQSPFPIKHRLYYTLSRAMERIDPHRSRQWEDACWLAVNEQLLIDAKRALRSLPKARFVREKAEVSLPVRVNFGGGWSDTPPYCLEHGGTVLNASLLLDGEMPVYALAERLSEPVVRIESDDLGVHRTYTSLQALRTGNPHDPHALCKAALAVCGVLPDGGEGDVAPLLEALGGGIRLYTAVRNVPKGSGLGTSSILCAAVARALSQLLGQPDDDARIASLALCMEQLMNTGGGWQDQVGGLLKGVKLISSQPGIPQHLTWRHIDMSDETFAAFTERSALVFTGQRRMARNILRDIMGKAVCGNPETMQVLSAIQRLAVLMAFELETGDLDQFARLLCEHWALSKRLDNGSSNTCIDHMLTASDDLIDGIMICGAGGGGFLYMLMKKGVTRDMLSERLTSVFQESGVKVWNAQLER